MARRAGLAIVTAMADSVSLQAPPAPPAFGWRRIRVVLAVTAVASLLFLPSWTSSWAALFARLSIAGLLVLGVFGLFERWPRRLPRWLARWGLQVAAVAVAVPFAMAIAYGFTTFGDPQAHWWQSRGRLGGYAMLTVIGLLLAPWVAVAALLRQIRGDAERQALAFELERSEFERAAGDARLRLLQAQVEPHFLFNTLANVRELVESGSPQAPVVLGHLIAYLRAAVPRLHGEATTLGQEIELTRAYLEVMQMRMPDRLQFTLHADEDAPPLDCPPMTLLTLVENAVRHGIDPSEDGGRIDVRVRVRDGRCQLEVLDTGAGLRLDRGGLGTGLATLRERLQLAFGSEATLRLAGASPRGVCAEVEFPARPAIAGDAA
jgi:hypothetical protein